MGLTRPKQINADFAYNVGKDIANLEHEVELLKNKTPELPPQQGIEFAVERFAFGDQCFRKLAKGNALMLMTGVFNNGMWYGDRPNDGIWQDPFTLKFYKRTGANDIETELTNLNMNDIEKYVKVRDVKVLTSYLNNNVLKANLMVHVKIVIDDDYIPSSYPETIILAIHNADQTYLYRNAISNTYEYYWETDIIVPQDKMIRLQLRDSNQGAVVIYDKDIQLDIPTDLATLIKSAEITIPAVTSYFDNFYSKDRFMIGVPTVKAKSSDYTSRDLAHKLEYRLNGKVQNGLKQDLYGEYLMIFDADTAEELQGEVEVWYNGERIK